MSYEYCINGKYCYSSNTIDATIISNNCLVKTENSLYTIDGTRIYNWLYNSETIIDNSVNNIGIDTTLTNSPQWRKQFESNNGPMNRYAVWFDTDCDEFRDNIAGEITISYSFENPNPTNKFYLGFGVWANSFNITLNNQLLISGGTNTMYNRYWHIIPITLLSCNNIINLTLTSSETIRDGFALAIYDNSYNELVSATSDSDLNIIFNTTSLLSTNGVIGPFVRAFCPSGYMLSANTVSATCIDTVYTACTCDCCNRYTIRYVSNNQTPSGNFVYYDCSGNVRFISPNSVQYQVEFCACDFITPINIISANEPFFLALSSDGQFIIENLTYECNALGCEPTPEPEPEPTCSECGFTMISVGYDHTVGISGGTLYSWGNNALGQLGVGLTGGMYDTPQLVDDTYNWIHVCAGMNSTFAINSLGQMWVCGLSTSLNGGDQLGLFNNTPQIYNSLELVTQPFVTGWVKVWSYSTVTIALRDDGSIYGTGWNEFNQLGIINITDMTQFTLISNDNWSEVAIGNYHVIGLNDSGNIFSWGQNLTNNFLINPLGLGSLQTAQVPTQIIPANYPNYPNGQTIRFTKIAAGNQHSVALSTTGGIWGWGSNSFGQLDCDNCGSVDLTRPFPMQGRVSPDGTYSSGGGYQYNTGYTYISAAADITVAITENRNVSNFTPTTINNINWDGNFTGKRIFTWGLGYGNSIQTLLQDSANRLQLELKYDWCSIWFGGPNTNDDLIFFAKDINGTIYTWGNNTFGQLGIPTPNNCSICLGDKVNPIGLCFNNCDEKCSCICVQYKIINYSSNSVIIRYITCDGLVFIDALESGGYGQSTTTLDVCACFDTISILSDFNPNLVIITTNQIPC